MEKRRRRMAKKYILSITVFLTISVAVFAYESFYTSDGTFVDIEYLGEKPETSGQEMIDFITKLLGGIRLDKLSNSQWGYVRQALRRYKTRRGEVYSISLVPHGAIKTYMFICEFTSNTQYNWWCFEVYH
jgi:hypothetical protein